MHNEKSEGTANTKVIDKRIFAIMLRVSREEKKILDKAALSDQRKLADYVRKCALECAKETIEKLKKA